MKRVNTIACLTALVLPSVARAHPEFTPAAVNRYIKVSLVGEDRARIAYTLMIGQTPALIERKAADRNANGRIEVDEARALGESWRKKIGAGIQITLDGDKVAPVFETPVVGMAGDEVGPETLSIDLITTVKGQASEEHTLVIDDATPVDRLGESEVRIEESPNATVVVATRGALTEATTAKQTRVLFRGEKFSALEDRRVSLRWREQRAFAAAARARWGWMGAVLLLVMAAAGFAVRRYWRRKG